MVGYSGSGNTRRVGGFYCQTDFSRAPPGISGSRAVSVDIHQQASSETKAKKQTFYNCWVDRDLIHNKGQYPFCSPHAQKNHSLTKPTEKAPFYGTGKVHFAPHCRDFWLFSPSIRVSSKFHLFALSWPILAVFLPITSQMFHSASICNFINVSTFNRGNPGLPLSNGRLGNLFVLCH